MKNKAFGLDIGVTGMKAVWLSKEKNGYLLNSVLQSPSPLKGMLSESPLDQQEMAKAIRKLVNEAKINTPYVNIALPENQVYTKVVEMPLLSDRELSSAIYWEAEQYIPVPLSGITLDYTILSKPQAANEGAKMQVLLVGAPTILIDKYEKIISFSGLTLTSVETEILSVIRGVTGGQVFPSSLIMNIGAMNTSLAIIKNGIVSFTYVIPTGGIALSRAIATDFGFSMAQAEEYKKTYGLSGQNEGGKIGKATEPIIMSIIGEMKKALVFYAEKYKDDPIKQILISGGTARLAGLTNTITNAMGIETKIANPWENLASQQVPKDIIDHAPEYSIAVGLAMREYE